MARKVLAAVRFLFTKERHMMLSGWLRPHRVLVAVVAIAAGALACRETTTPKEVSNARIGEPRFTAASEFVTTLIARGNLGTFHIQSKADKYDVELKSHDNTDIVVGQNVVAAGGHSGWHSHPGPVLVVVKSGVITFYHGDDPTCTGTVHPAGTVFIEEGGTVGIARNEGTDPATVVATFFVPAGSPTRIDAPAPGNCSF
jgi:quercetin dioxygenase-like cupin family protein